MANGPTYARGDMPEAPPQPIRTMPNVDAEMPNLTKRRARATCQPIGVVAFAQPNITYPKKPRAVGFANLRL